MSEFTNFWKGSKTVNDLVGGDKIKYRGKEWIVVRAHKESAGLTNRSPWAVELKDDKGNSETAHYESGQSVTLI
jgi:hypothetical protein